MCVVISTLTSRRKVAHLLCCCYPVKPTLWAIFNVVDFDACRLFSTLLPTAQSNQSGTKWQFPKTARIRIWRSSLLYEWINLKTWSTLGKCLDPNSICFACALEKFSFFKILQEEFYFFLKITGGQKKFKYRISISSVIYNAFSIFLASLFNACQSNNLNFKQHSPGNCWVVFFL